MRLRVNAFLSVVVLCVSTTLAQVQAVPAPTYSPAAIETNVAKLPPRFQERGRSLLKEADEEKRRTITKELAREAGNDVLEFFLSVIVSDPSPRVRLEILDRLDRLGSPKVRQVQLQMVLADTDTKLALLALEQLRMWQARELSQILSQRIEKARTRGDQTEMQQLAQEQERWISVVRGTMLPAFMRTPPPVFSLKEQNATIRFLAFGDFGTGSDTQKQTAAAMQNYHRQNPFDFGVTLGDNFYGDGMESPSDPRWNTQWESLYAGMGIKVYATFGNHDWDGFDSPAAQILYSLKSPSWRLPAPYYTFTAGAAQFFAIDTNEVSEAQLIWLKDELTKSRATWKIVYGHHPIYSTGTLGDTPALIAQLLPVLKGRADVFLCGHDHDLQHLKAEDGLHFFISGGAGAGLRPVKPGPRTLFAKSTNGFCAIEVDSKRFKVRFMDTSLTQLHEAVLEKSGASAVLAGSQGAK